MSILIKILKDGKPESHKIEMLPVFLGSGREKGMLQIDDSGKVGKQFVIYKKDSSYKIKKLADKTLIVNQKKITKEGVVLQPGINKIIAGSTKLVVKIPDTNQPKLPGAATGKKLPRTNTRLKYLLIGLWAVAIIALGYYVLHNYVLLEDLPVTPPIVEDNGDIVTTQVNPFSVKVEGSNLSGPGIARVKITIEDKNAGVEDLKNYLVFLKISGGRDSKEIPVFTVNSPNPRQKINVTASTDKIELNTTISLLSPGTKNIQARIIRSRDKKEAVHSVNITVRDIPRDTIPPLTLPSTVDAYEATNIAQTGFTANWSTSTTNTGYKIDVSTNNNFSSFVTGYNNLDVGNINSRSVSGLDAGTTYYYRVRAYNNRGISSNSNTIYLTTAAAPLPPPIEDGDASPNFVRTKWDNTGLILSIRSTQDKPYEIENFSGKNTTAEFKEISNSNSNYEIIYNDLNDIPPVIEIKIKGFRRPVKVQK